MAMSAGDAIVRVLGDTKPLNQAMSDAEKRTQSAAKKMQNALKMTGMAFTAMGVAGLAIIQSTKKINASLGVTALSLGVTKKEMRDLALETTNVTFPIKEVTASFDFLARAGIKDQKVLAATATAFDTLGDAIGMGAGAVTEIMVPAMKTFKLSAEEVAGKTDMMTYMIRNSTISLEDFNTMVGYTDQEMVAAGFTLDDMAAAMMYLSDSGVEPGKVMLREWNKAVTKSKEENISMTKALGMTSDELETYKGKLDGAIGVTQEYADVANEQYTLMDNVKQKWSELTLAASSFLEPLEPILAGMTALGPLMIALSTSAGQAALKWIAHTIAVTASAIMHPIHTATLIASKIALIASAIAIKAVTVAQWLWNAAITANPIGLIIMAIAGLIAIVVTVISKWKEVAKFFENLWRNIKIIFLTGVEKVLGVLQSFLGWIPGIGDKIAEAREKISSLIDAEKVAKDAQLAEQELEKYYQGIRDNADQMVADVEEAYDAWETKAEETSAALIADLEKQKTANQEHFDEQVEAINEYYGEVEDAAEESGKTQREIVEETTDANIAKHEEATAANITKFEEQRDAKISAAKDAAAADIAALESAADAERSAMQSRIDFYSSKSYEKIRIIGEVMLAEIAAIDPAVASILEGFNKEMEGIDERAAARKQAAEDLRKLNLETQLARDDITDDERTRLESELSALVDQQLERQLIIDRNNEIAALEMDEFFEDGIIALDETLVEEIAARQTAADDEVIIISKKYNSMIVLEEGKLAASLILIETEEVAALAAIEAERLAKIEALGEELTAANSNVSTLISLEAGRLSGAISGFSSEVTAFKSMNDDKLTDARAFVVDYNAIMSGLGGEGIELPEPDLSWGLEPAPLTLPIPQSFPSTPDFPTMVGGGMINEPTLLTSMRTMAPYAIAGEAGPERLLGAAETARGGGYGAANIIIMLDSEVIGRRIGEPLVDEIRVRTGVAI